MASVQAVVVLSPRGGDLMVTQIILDAGRTVWMLSADGPKHVAKRSYESLDDAYQQHSRATTTALLLEFASDADALELLGKSPPAM